MTRIIIPDNFMGINTAEAYRKVMEESKKPETQKLEMPVISSGNYWQVPGVEYRNGIYTVNLLKTLLDNGETKPQDEWIEYSLEARKKGEIYTGSMPFQYSLFRTLSSQEIPEALEAREFIKKQMREKWLMTTTRLRYNPSGKDEIIHDYKMPDEFSFNVDLVGKDKLIEQNDAGVLEALLLDSDANRVNKVFNSINGTNAYIWRLNSKPKQRHERVAWFDAGSGGALLNCNWDPSLRYSSLGVYVVSEAGGNAS